MKKLLLFLLAGIIAAGCFAGCGGNKNPDDNKDPDDNGGGNEQATVSEYFSLNHESLLLSVGKSEQLFAFYHDRDQQVLWKSSDDSVVSVNADGFITALKIGRATITATFGKYSGACEITVVGQEYSPVLTLSHEKVSVFAGDRFEVSATLTIGGKEIDETLAWTSSDESVASVSDGVITGKKAGTAIVTVSAAYGKVSVSEQIEIKVVAGSIFFVKDTNVKIAVASISGEATETVLSTVFINKDGDVENKAVVWNSSDTTVATVDQDGRVVAVKAGDVRISAICDDGGVTRTAWTDVKVYKAEVSEVKNAGDAEVGADDKISVALSAVGYSGTNGETVKATFGKKTFDGVISGDEIVITTDGEIYGDYVVAFELTDRIVKANLHVTSKFVSFKANIYVKENGSYVLKKSNETFNVYYGDDLLNEVMSFGKDYVINTADSDELKISADGTSVLDLYYETGVPIARTGGAGYFFAVSEKGELGNKGVSIEKLENFASLRDVYMVTNNVRRTYIKVAGIDAATAKAAGYSYISFKLYYKGSPNVVGNHLNTDNPAGTLFSFHASWEMSKDTVKEYVSLYNAAGGAASNTNAGTWTTVKVSVDKLLSNGNNVKTMEFHIGCEQGASFYIQGATLE
ncbi:MAG: Ig-like domain-containing protein [Clostridia bacterium]|nr:Ig-like domain-containing protein [Clostridia bacterium]